jgi:hypothetical protein
MGEKAVVSSGELVRLKYSVAAVSPPLSILLASSKSELLDAIEAMRAGGQFAGTACRVTLVPAVERTVKQQ